MPGTATLVIMSGLPDLAGRTFEVGPGTTTLGRALSCDIQLPDPGVSRLHAELVWEGDVLFLVHRSGVNRTLVDGDEITDRVALSGGEEIQLADRVVFRVRMASDDATVVSTDPTPASEAPLSEAAEAARPDAAAESSPDSESSPAVP